MNETQEFRDARIKLAYYMGGMAGMVMRLADIANSCGANPCHVESATREFGDLVQQAEEVAKVLWPKEEYYE